ncbi:ribosomal RNA small subunit methyltransferase A [Schaalia sp. lx-100]|uniref:ribosomal RNA small subunit methyltransferase A n=1 Tax=Schaalia sp. lx-100 TaxID=2899081 RepID=UPI001E53E88C|nr:16S rRNA (adenine(1518)-N(6)/adenine(1519)-N(6))-dimethyltransferase [Schaalia sp. lx-100]
MTSGLTPRRRKAASHTRHSRLDPTLPAGVTPCDTGLLGPLEVRAIAEALGIRPTKVLGQNFVHDAGTVRRIVRAAGIESGDEVVEVGPGLGSLTLALLEAGARVRAVEIDPPLAHALPETIRARMPEAAERFRVVLGDAMNVRSCDDLIPSSQKIMHTPEQSDKFLPSERAGSINENNRSDTEVKREDELWPAPTKLVANLPYNVAVPVILSLLEHLPSLRDVLVMVQAEVADRLAAEPGSRTYGVPSVKAAWYGQAQRVGTIGRSVFWPIPNVDSALVHLQRNAEPRGDHALRLATFEVCDVAFGQRRKTLRAALRRWSGGTEQATELIESAGIDPSVRGETLSIDDFVTLGVCLLDMREKGIIPPRQSTENMQERRGERDA